LLLRFFCQEEVSSAFRLLSVVIGSWDCLSLVHFVLWIASEPQNLQRISAFSVLAAAAAAADHHAPELRLRHFIFCVEGALDTSFSVKKELEVLIFCEGGA